MPTGCHGALSPDRWSRSAVTHTSRVRRASCSSAGGVGELGIARLGVLFALRDGSPVIESVGAQWTVVREAVSASFWDGPLPVWVLVHPLVDDVLVQPLVAATLVVLWGYPLAGLVIRSWRAGRAASSVRVAVLGGTVAGLAFLPLLLALRLALRSVLTPELRALPHLPDALYIWTLIVALGLQAVVSAVVAARATELFMAHASLAASISGSLAAGGALGATAIASGAHIFAVRVDPAGCGAVQLQVSDLHAVVQFTIGGALLAIPAAAAVHIVRTASDRSRTVGA